MKTQISTPMGVAAAAAAILLACAGGAFAQSSDATVGGSTTDMTSAGNTNGGGLPQIQHQGSIDYVSGGVGLDESTALKQAARTWPLALRFTGPRRPITSPTSTCASWAPRMPKSSPPIRAAPICS